MIPVFTAVLSIAQSTATTSKHGSKATANCRSMPVACLSIGGRICTARLDVASEAKANGARAESLQLINSMLIYYNIQFLHELTPIAAWGRIDSGDYPNPNRLIASIGDNKRSIVVKRRRKTIKDEFAKKYRNRFDDETGIKVK
jgi:hypothetical protein